MTLSPLDPAIGLADRLREDRFVTVPVRPWPRIAAIGVAGVAFLLWVLALRSSALGRPWPGPGFPASVALFAIGFAAVGALLVMARAWPARELRLPLAPTQTEQVARVEAQARLMRIAVLGGLAVAASGLVVLAICFRFVPQPQWAAVLGLGSLLLAAGTVAAVAGLARWLPTRMLYVQTLVLQRLEDLGLGHQLAMDPRTADVLVSLDAMLGELPESAVRQFLSRPEAEWYIELIAEVKGARRGR